jgi:hypothetical protein
MTKIELVGVPGSEDAYEAALDTMLSYLGADMPVKRHNCRPVTLRDFDGAWPFVNPLLEGHTRYSAHTLDEECIPSSAAPEELVNPLDITIMGAMLEDVGPIVGARGGLIPLAGVEKTLGFSINRVRRRYPAELRGQLRVAARHIIEYSVLTLPFEGDPETFRFLWGWIDGGWVGVDLPYYRDKGNRLIWSTTTTNRGTIADDGWLHRIRLAYGIAKFFDRQWSVYFGFDGNLGLSFPTSPEHAQEVFRLRDVPPGAKRRAALKHWVREHNRRRSADDPVATIPVMRHLRGAETFHWNGLTCRIKPSPVDLRDLAQRRAGRRRDRSGPSVVKARPTPAEIETAVTRHWATEERARARDGAQRWETFWTAAAFRPSWRQRLRRRWRRLRTWAHERLAS